VSRRESRLVGFLLAGFEFAESFKVPYISGGWRWRLKSGDRELPHHPIVLMFEDMAVVHEGRFHSRLVELD
jgi:hypothetical protein